MVVTSFPLEQILRNPNTIDRVVGWRIELQPFGLKFDTTRVIKGRALADFLAVWIDTQQDEPWEERSATPEPPPGQWTTYFDTVFASKCAGAGAVLTCPSSDKLYYSMLLCFNNEDNVSNKHRRI